LTIERKKLTCYIYNKDGFYSTGITIPYTAEQIASFIVLTKDAYSVKMVEPKGDTTEFETFKGQSSYLDYAWDKEFLEDKLLPVLLAIQEDGKKPNPIEVISWNGNVRQSTRIKYFIENFNVNFSEIPVIERIIDCAN